MKFTISKSILENILINMQPFLEKKDTSQITSHIYIESNNENVTFKSTDHEIGLVIQTREVRIESDGKITANGKKLLDMIRSLKNENVILEEENGILYILQNRSKYELNTYNANEYPSFPNIEDKPKIEIDSTLLIQSLKKITPAIDTNNPKYELNGALININENKIAFVSTDTRRLALVTVDNNSSDELSVIIPKKAILEIQKLFFNNIEIYYDKTYLIIKNEQFFFFTKLINGNYPDYTRIIPKDINKKFKLPKSKIIEAIKQIMIVSSEIKITFLPNSIKFESMSKDGFVALTEIEHQNDTEDEIILAVHNKYILDFLSQITTSDFEILINKSNLPFMLKSEDFLTIIMPISI